jgi:PAS domain S-box-containing protein
LETTSLHDIGYLRTILNAVQTGILMIDAENHRIVYANPAAFQIIGHPKELVIGAVCHSFICPAEVGKCPITDIGQSIDNSERAVIDARGERVPVLKTVVPTVTEGRKYLIESFLDIRERKQSEQRLLSERLAAIAELAGMVGHDLRNPLQGIAGAAYLLRNDSLSPKERNELLQLIDDGVRYSNAIVGDLLDYSAEIRLKLEEAAPKSIIQDAIKAVKVPESVTLRDLSEDHPILRVDLNRMRRVCINILTNAIEAMPEGGEITIASKRSGDNIEIAFTDTGPGMSEKAIENLWKPLQTTKAKGMGFGLAICKRIVEAHRGIIRAESSIGKGSTFTVSLPIRSATIEEVASEH